MLATVARPVCGGAAAVAVWPAASHARQQSPEATAILVQVIFTLFLTCE
ncbi:hypothetical protein [Streptomyces sp. NPDC021020]